MGLIEALHDTELQFIVWLQQYRLNCNEYRCSERNINHAK